MMRERRRMLAAALALIGLVGIVGWILGSTPLRQWVPSSPPISASSCLAFLIAAGTFFFLESTDTVRGRIQSLASGAAIFVLSSLALIDRVSGSNLAADYFLFPRDPNLLGVDARGRMSLANAVAFLLVSAALLLAGRRMRGGFQPSEWLFFGSGAIGLIAALGYAFNDPSLSGFPGFHQVSLPGSIGMLVLSVTGLLAWPESGLMATLTGRGPGAILARRLLFPASALLILTAFARSVGERRGLYSPEFGSAAFVILNLILLASLVAVTMERLERAAADRATAEEALRRSEVRFRSLVENSHEVIELFDKDGRIHYISPSVQRIAGYSPQEALDTRTFGERIHPDDVEGVRDRFRGLVGIPGDQRSFEFRLRHKNGSWLEIAAVAVNRLADPNVGAIVVNLHDITERKQAEDQRRRSYEELRALAARMETVREDEASRIAHELHDEIGQALTAVKIHLQTLQKRPAASAICEELGESVGFASRALDQVRDLSLVLRPSVLDDLGLEAALRWYLDRQAQLSGFAAELSSDLPPGRLARELETACFRVGQQALTNVARHARARRVSMDLRRGKTELLLSVRDDGVGFDVAAARARALSGKSLGILGMEERVSLLGGVFEVRSGASSGTEVSARFPLSEGFAPAGRR